MANTNAPFGFAEVGLLDGHSPTYGQTVRKIASNNATAIYRGDPVTSLSTGYITRSTAGTTQIAGIFVGCKYLSVAMGRTVYSPYYPGSDASGDVEAYVIANPAATFRVQAGTGNVVLGNVGNNANFALGTGNTSTGLSGAYLDTSTISTTATLPFRILGLIVDPPGGNGTDSTSAYNWVLVGFNFVDTKSTTGI